MNKPELILIRHPEAEVNKEGAIGLANRLSPLTPRGVNEQIPTTRELLRKKYGIDPYSYDEPVMTSTYNRTQQAARELGFRILHHLPSLNEMEMDGTMDGRMVVAKHAAERWAPDETHERAEKLVRSLIEGTSPYKIGVSHGMFIASVCLHAEASGQFDTSELYFDSRRGYVPLQSAVTAFRLAR